MADSLVNRAPSGGEQSVDDPDLRPDWRPDLHPDLRPDWRDGVRQGAHAPFSDPAWTADGARRATVSFDALETLWVNTGTLCNIECANCYIESSPTNDSLVYLRLDELLPHLNDAARLGAREIAFTGGEPFLNPDMPAMAEAVLSRGFHALILTNAMRPAMRPRVREAMRALNALYRDRLTLRVSIDHYTAARHDEERGAGSFDIAIDGVRWFAREGFSLSFAGRSLWGESDAAARAGYQTMFDDLGLGLDAGDPAHLVVFPEMDETAPTPEITDACWGLLGKDPASVMCARTRMLVKRKGAQRPTLLACTLIPYDPAFELGATLAEAARPVSLNHPHCSRFCVLGGANCSG